MAELNDEQKQRIEKAKAAGGMFCATCKRPIDLTSDDVFSANDGRLWCNEWCMSRPKVTR